MILSQEFRLLPRRSQHRALEGISESQRQLYNAAVQERIEAYRKAGKSLAYFDQTRGLTEWRNSDPDGRALPVKLQRATLKRVDRAFSDFYRRRALGGKAGFPRFKGKGRFDSFSFLEWRGINLVNGSLQFQGMPGRLRVHWHRIAPAVESLKGCTFKRDRKGWAVILLVSIQDAAPRRTQRTVGVDLGISTFAALSNGECIPSLRSARKAERQLRVAQRALSRKKKGSGGRRKARLALSRCHAAVALERKNHLHQASTRLVRNYDVIAIERLKVKPLANSILAKDVRDASWASFISMLRYKAACAGARVIEVEPYDTSQECSGCGDSVVKALKRRLHECPSCGLVLDRDVNAARNILNRAGVGPGLPNVADCGMRAGGKLGSPQGETGDTPDKIRTCTAQLDR